MHTEDQALRIIVMGVSGCGKSTLAQGLSQTLQLRMKDGDELHLPESVEKMRAGVALQDEDRWPWLDRIAQYLTATEGSHSPGGIVADYFAGSGAAGEAAAAAGRRYVGAEIDAEMAEAAHARLAGSLFSATLAQLSQVQA